MKLIITGATGFIGRNLAERFHADGFQVVATGRSERVGDELREKGVVFETADITDLERLKTVFSKSDCVIHCAARPGD
jgi:nucleoside-diphosphate-sugar epimerase